MRDAALVARKLGEFGRPIVASPEYLKKHGRPKTPEDLARHNCLMFSGHPHLNQWPFRDPHAARAGGEAGDHRGDAAPGGIRLMQIAGNLIANNGETIVQMALMGLGIARLGEFVSGPAIKAGLLVPILQEFNSHDRLAISAVYPSRRHLAPKVTAFVDFLAAKFLPKPPWEA